MRSDTRHYWLQVRVPAQLFAIIVGVAAIQACSDSNKGAEKLFEKAKNSHHYINNGDFMKYRLERLQSVASIIETILKKYPSSDIAKELMAGRSVSGISKSEIQKELAKTKSDFEKHSLIWKDCSRRVSSDCLLALARLNADYTSHLLRGKATRHIVVALATTGEYAEAQTLAAQIDHLPEQAVALAEVGKALAKSGRKENAGKLFDMAEAIASGRIINNDIRHSTLREIVRAETESEFFKKAKTTTELMNKDWQKNAQYYEIFQALIKLQRLDDASSLLAKISGNDERVQALATMALEFSLKGDRVRAEKHLSQAVELNKQTSAGRGNEQLAKIAVAQAAIFSIDRALAVTKRIDDGVSRSHGLLEIVTIMLRRRDLDAANRAAALIPRPFRGAEANNMVAIALNAANRQPEAKVVFQRALDHLTKADSISEFERKALGAGFTSVRIGYLSRIGSSQSKSGNKAFAQRAFSLADKLQKGMQNREERIAALLAIARAKRASGRTVEADAALSVARDLSGSIHPIDCQMDTIQTKLAIALAKAKRVAAMREVVGRIRCSYFRVQFNSRLASTL